MGRPRWEAFETAGLAVSGIWVRKQKSTASLTDEALALTQVWQTWDLARHMSVDHYGAVLAEVSGQGLEPEWVHLVEVAGRRLDSGPLTAGHPVSHLAPDDPFRLLALVRLPQSVVLGALVESGGGRRLLWARRSNPA